MESITSSGCLDGLHSEPLFGCESEGGCSTSSASAAAAVLQTEVLMTRIAARLPVEDLAQCSLATKWLHKLVQMPLAMRALGDEQAVQSTPHLHGSAPLLYASLHVRRFQAGPEVGCRTLCWLLPQLHGVRCLSLCLRDVSQSRLVCILHACAPLRGLTQLALHKANLASGAAVVLADWVTQLPHLRHLRIADADLTRFSANALLGAFQTLRALTVLDLDGTEDLYDELMHSLLHLCSHDSLRVLHMSAMSGRPAAEAWSHARYLVNLHIDIRHVRPDASPLRWLTNLRVLQVRGKQTYSEGYTMLRGLAELTKLTALSVPLGSLVWGAGGDVEDPAAATASCLSLPHLVDLQLCGSDDGFSLDDVDGLARLSVLTGLTGLLLRYVGATGPRRLIPLLISLRQLRVLDAVIRYTVEVIALSGLTGLTRLSILFCLGYQPQLECNPQLEATVETALKKLTALREVKLEVFQAFPLGGGACGAAAVQAVANSPITRLHLAGFPTFDGSGNFWTREGPRPTPPPILAPRGLVELRVQNGIMNSHLCALEVLHLLTSLTLLQFELVTVPRDRPEPPACFRRLGAVLATLRRLRELELAFNLALASHVVPVLNGLWNLTRLTGLTVDGFGSSFDDETAPGVREAREALARVLPRMSRMQVLHVKRGCVFALSSLQACTGLRMLRTLSASCMRAQAPLVNSAMSHLAQVQELLLLGLVFPEDQQVQGFEWLAQMRALTRLEVNELPYTLGLLQLLGRALPLQTELQEVTLYFVPPKQKLPQQVPSTADVTALCRSLCSMTTLVTCDLLSSVDPVFQDAVNEWIDNADWDTPWLTVL